jgi:DegV family protein with EDD domain
LSIAIVTDSGTMIPPSLAASHQIRVVPLTVVIDEQAYLDGVELAAEELYARVVAAQQISTSQPSPGRILQSYERAVADGATAILSVHIGSNTSGTVQSARVAAGMISTPVHVVDTGQASFAAGLCVLEAAGEIAGGATLAEAENTAQRAASQVGNTFVVKALDLIRRSGRFAGTDEEAPGVPVLALERDGVKVTGQAQSLPEAVDLMSRYIAAAADAAGAQGQSLRVGIGHGAGEPIARDLRARVDAMRHIGEVIEYVVGPSIGAHLGPGNAGAVFIARPIS